MNAKTEFLRTTENVKVICARISHHPDWDTEILINLKPGYTQDEYNEFINALDFEYDAGYGTQHVYGRIWCEDGIWFTRHEYDGSESWQSHKYPTIPPMEDFIPLKLVRTQEEYWDGDNMPPSE